MKENKTIRNKWLTIRLNEAEEKKLQEYVSKSTAQSVSEYARGLLLNEPVTVLYRNQSADDCLMEMIRFKKEVNAIGTNYNQAIKKLHTLTDVADIKSWVSNQENGFANWWQLVKEINEKLGQIHDQLRQQKNKPANNFSITNSSHPERQ
jgi:MobC-like protein